MEDDGPKRTDAGLCRNANNCNRIHYLTQQQSQSETTRLLFRGENFQPTRSDQDMYYDCLSVGDSDSQHVSKFDDPNTIRDVLERAHNATQMLLKNFDRTGQGWNRPREATLEITARLISDKKQQMTGRPVTVQMPLEFDPQSGELTSACLAQQRQQQQDQRSICPCESAAPVIGVPPFQLHELQAAKPGKAVTNEQYAMFSCDTIHSASLSAEANTHLESYGDSRFCSECKCTGPTCMVPCPNQYEQRDVISICCLRMPIVVATPPLTPSPELESDTEKKFALDEEGSGLISDVPSSPPLSSPSPEPEPEPEREPSTDRHYYLALPQHCDFANCSPCRFHPSPIMDEDGNVFCPGNCGCCQCPWRRRSFDDNREHINVKVCKCVQRGTIFSTFDERENCSQTSYFDFCPCREKAEAKFLELYNCEMWSLPNITRGREVHLSEIKELQTPPQHSAT